VAPAAAATAAFATPVPASDGAPPSLHRPSATVRVISTSGMAGWQITVIDLGAAPAAAAAAVLLDRKLAGRSGTTAASA
jgi:hypothetical protein